MPLINPTQKARNRAYFVWSIWHHIILKTSNLSTPNHSMWIGDRFQGDRVVEKKSMGGEPRFWPLVRPRRHFEPRKCRKSTNSMIFVWLSFLTSPLVTSLTSLNFGPRIRRKFNRFIPNPFLLQLYSISTSFVLKVNGSTCGDRDSLEWASLKNRRHIQKKKKCEDQRSS